MGHVFDNEVSRTDEVVGSSPQMCMIFLETVVFHVACFIFSKVLGCSADVKSMCMRPYLVDATEMLYFCK